MNYHGRVIQAASKPGLVPLLFAIAVVQALTRIWLFVTPQTVAHQTLCAWGSPGKSTGVGCHFLLQRIFPTQGSNLNLLRWQAHSSTLSHLGSPVSTIRFFLLETKIWKDGEISFGSDIRSWKSKRLGRVHEGERRGEESCRSWWWTHVFVHVCVHVHIHVTCMHAFIFLHIDKGMGLIGSQHNRTLRIKVTLNTSQLRRKRTCYFTQWFMSITVINKSCLKCFKIKTKKLRLRLCIHFFSSWRWFYCKTTNTAQTWNHISIWSS